MSKRIGAIGGIKFHTDLAGDTWWLRCECPSHWSKHSDECAVKLIEAELTTLRERAALADDPGTKGLYDFARKCGWGKHHSRPPASFIEALVEPLVKVLEDANNYCILTDSEGYPPLKAGSNLAKNMLDELEETLANARAVLGETTEETP